MKYWCGHCPLSGIDEPKLLRASHIKSWAESTDKERLSPYNGVLLSANLDAAFDSGLISFSNDGQFPDLPRFPTPISRRSAQSGTPV